MLESMIIRVLGISSVSLSSVLKDSMRSSPSRTQLALADTNQDVRPEHLSSWAAGIRWDSDPEARRLLPPPPRSSAHWWQTCSTAPASTQVWPDAEPFQGEDSQQQALN